MRKLIDINDGALLVNGVFPDVAENQAQLWREGVNVEFKTTKIYKAIGFNCFEDATAPVIALSQAYVDGEQRVYYAEATKILKSVTGVPVELGSGFTAGRWSLEPWGNWLIATNNIEVPQVWKNTGVMIPLPGVRRTKFKLVKKHKNHFFGYFGQSVDWSSDSNPELWEPDANNSAGGNLLRDLDSDIIAACPIGADFAIYSTDRMILQRYIGEPFFYSFEPAVEGIGAVSDSAIVPVANKNYGMGKKGFFVTDGISFDYIATKTVKDWVVFYFDSVRGEEVVGLHDEKNESVKWWFPCYDGIIRGVVYQYKTNAWGTLQQPITAAASLEVFANPLVGSLDCWGFLTGSNNGDELMPSSLESFPLDAGQRENHKLWDMLRVNFSGTGLELRFGFSTEADETPEWTAWTPLERENYIDRECVFLRFAFRSTGLNEIWTIEGLSIHGEITGYL